MSYVYDQQKTMTHFGKGGMTFIDSLSSLNLFIMYSITTYRLASQDSYHNLFSSKEG